MSLDLYTYVCTTVRVYVYTSHPWELIMVSGGATPGQKCLRPGCRVAVKSGRTYNKIVIFKGYKMCEEFSEFRVLLMSYWHPRRIRYYRSVLLKLSCVADRQPRCCAALGN